MRKAFGGLKYKALCKKYYLSFCKIKGLAFTRPTFMPAKGFEPSLSHLNSDLNAARLPIPPLRQLLEHIYHTKKLIKLERKILITEQDNLFFLLLVRSSQQNFLLKIMLFISI